MPQESQVAGVSPPPSLLGLHFYRAWPSSDYPSNTTATSSVGPWVRFPPRGEILTSSAKELQKQKKRINYYTIYTVVAAERAQCTVVGWYCSCNNSTRVDKGKEMPMNSSRDKNEKARTTVLGGWEQGPLST